MKNLENIQAYDAIGQKLLMDTGEISSKELTDYYINQIKQKNPELNAVVHTMFEEASKKGEQTRGEGYFAGMPFLVKDLNPLKGYPSTSGSKMLQDLVPGRSDEIIERFQRSGLHVLGKTNTAEFGFLPTTEPDLFGATKNPWDPTRSAGGSSGGSAAAVASGMIPFAHASDGGGSIRIPASACGLFGFKPSRGQLPYSPYMNHLSVNHALTRSVRDSAALLDVIHGEAPGDLYPTFAKKSGFLQATTEEPRKLRIAVTPDLGGRVSIDDETQKAFQQSVQLMKDLGHEVYEASPQFDFHGFANNFIKVWVAGGAVVIKHLGMVSGQEPGPDNLEPLSYNVFKQGSELSAMDYEEARVMLQMESQKLLNFHDQYDILLSPVLNKLPAPLGSFKQTNPQAMFTNFTDYCSFTPISNVTGQPSMSMPLYWTEKGIPIGAHFTGRLGEDELLFMLAAQIEREKPWFNQYKQL